MSFLNQLLSNITPQRASVSPQTWLLLVALFFSLALSAQEMNDAFIQPIGASQSSFGFANGEAANAIDGNTNGNWIFGPANSITHTNIQSNPWLEIDLGAEYDISRIELWNRTDACCAGRLTNMNVLVKSCEDDLGTPVLTENYQYNASDNVPLDLPASQKGRYVRVQLYGSNTILHLAEVKVFGRAYGTDKPACACLESADADFCSLTAMTGVSDGFIELNWDFIAPVILDPGSPIFCRLLRIDDEGKETTILSSSHNTPTPEERLIGSFIDRVAADKTYDYRLEVRNEEFGILGKQFTATGSTAAFQAPTDFTATDGAALDRVNLSWQHHTDLPISYRILRIDANQDTIQLDTVSRESDEDLILTYEDVYQEGSNSGLRSGQAYQYCIEPYYAPTVTAYPTACEEGAVTDLAFAASDDAHPDRVRLSWNSLAEVAEELAIYENDLLIATLPATRQSFDRIAPVAGKPHRYRLEVTQSGATLIAATDTGSIAPNGTISGRVTTLDQELPVAGVTVIWSVTLSDTILTDSVLTDGTGYYAFVGLYYEESADFTVRVRKENASFQEEEKAVTLSGEAPNVSLVNFKQLELEVEDAVADSMFDFVVSDPLRDQDKLRFELGYSALATPLFLDITRDGERMDLLEFSTAADLLDEWVDSTGVPGKRYLYQFKVFYYDQDTVRSDRAASNATFPVVTPPTELSELALANGFMELSWAHTSTNFSGFRLLRGEEEIKALSTEEFTFTDGKGIPGMEDYGLVAIRTVEGEEYRSDTVRLQVAFPTIPSPTELVAATFPDRVQLTWTIPDELATGFDYSGFQVYRNGELIGTVYKGFPTEFIDFTGSQSTAYEYTVRTFRLLLGKVAESAPTAVTETFPAVSPALTFTASDADASLPNSVELSWTTDPEARVDGYRILRDGREIARINTTKRSLTVTANHAEEQPYSIQGFRKVDGQDQFSTALVDVGAPLLEADKILDPIQNFVASQDQAGQIGLSWSYPTFLTGSFEIRRQSSTGGVTTIATIDAAQFLSKTTQAGQDIYHFSFVDADPAINQTFTYWIRAVQASFLSPYAYAEGRVPNGIRVRGRVYDEESGQGIANVRVALNGDGNALAVHTDSSGHYLFEDIVGRPAIPGLINLQSVFVTIDEPGDAYSPFGVVFSSTVSEPTEHIINFTSKAVLPALEEAALAKVVTVSATALDCDLEAVIAWGADHNNYDGFEVARGVNIIGEVLKGEELVFRDESNTNPGALQVYQVRAFLQTPTGRLYTPYKSAGVVLPVFASVRHLSASIASEGNAVDLSWSHPCQNHTGFLISRNDEVIDTVYTDAANQYQDITGVPGEKYIYAITPFWQKASDLLKARAKSVVVDYPEIALVSDLQVSADFKSDYEIPFDPFTEGSVTIPAYFTNQVRLEWSYDSPYCQGFAVFRDSILLSDTLDNDVTTYFDNAATPESAVEYRVVAILERDGKSYYSKPLTTSFAVPKLIKPIRMRQKVASGVVTISFHYPTEREITGFNVRRIPSGGSSIILNPVFTQSEITTSYFEFSDSTGIPGRTYVYVVQSFLEGEEEYTSSFSGRNATFPALPAPDNFTASDNVSENFNNITLSWTYEQQFNVDSFIIERSINTNDNFVKIDSVFGGSRQYDDILNADLGDRNVYYRIKARKKVANGTTDVVVYSTPSTEQKGRAGILETNFNILGAADQDFVTSVALYGNWMVVGSPQIGDSNQGGIIIYRFDGKRWRAWDDSIRGTIANGKIGTTIDFDGKRIIAGGIGDIKPIIAEYDYNQNRWIRLSGLDGREDLKGNKVTIHNDWMATWQTNSRDVRLFDVSDSFAARDLIRVSENPRLLSLDISDDFLVVGVPEYKLSTEPFSVVKKGFFSIYQKGEFSNWGLYGTIEFPGDFFPEARLGKAVGISASTLAVSAEDVVLVYGLKDGFWESEGQIVKPQLVESYGDAISITESHLAILVNRAVYLYERAPDGSGWFFLQQFGSVAGPNPDISIDDRHLVIGKLNGLSTRRIHPGLSSVKATGVLANTPTKTTINWTYDSGNHPAEESIKGFNVYRDGELLSNSLLDPEERSFVDQDGIAGKEHVYEVEMIWLDGLTGPRLADLGSRAGVGRIEGKVVTNTPSQSGVAGVTIVATGKVDEEYYRYETVSEADGSFNLSKLYIGTEMEETDYSLEAKYKDHSFEFDPKVTLRLDQTVGNRLILDNTAFVVAGNVKREYFSCGLDSVGVTATFQFNDGSKTQEKVLTNAEGDYSLTVDPTKAGLEKIEISIDSFRVLNAGQDIKERYAFRAEQATVITDFINLKRATRLDFTDTFTYGIPIRVIDACKQFISSDQFVIRATSADGCYDRVFTTRKDFIGRITAELPPLELSLRVEDVKNQAVDITSLVAVDYFRFRPATLDLATPYLDENIKTAEIVAENATDFVYHKPPTIAITSGRNFICDNPDFGAVVQQGDNYEWTVKVTEDHEETSCEVSEGMLRITNPGAANPNPVVLNYDEVEEEFPAYAFKAGQPNIVPPNKWAVTIECFSPEGSLLGKIEQELLVEGIAAVPGNGALVGADTAGSDVIQLPLFVLRKPPGDLSYSTIAKGTSISKTISINESLESGIGLLAEAQALVGGIGGFSAAEVVTGSTNEDGFAWEYSVTTAEIYSTERVGDDLIVGMGLAQQYGLQQRVQLKEDDCEKILLTQILGLSPIEVKTQWSYSVGEIEEIIRQLELRIARIESGAEIINGPDGMPMPVDEAAERFDVVATNWREVLVYHREKTVPHYVICTQQPPEGIPANVRQAITDWQCEFCPKVAVDYNCDTREFTDFNPDVAWNQELVDLYNKAYAAINGLLKAPFAEGTLRRWKLSLDRLNEPNSYVDGEFDAVSGMPQAQYFTSGQEGGTRSFSAATSSTRSYSNATYINSDISAGLALGIEIDAGISIFGASIETTTVEVEGKIGGKVVLNYNLTEDRSRTVTETVEQEYFIGDDDPGDTYTVAVIQGPAQNHTPYFWTLGGNSSCPVEEGTLPRDRMDINLYNPITDVALGKIGSLEGVEEDEAYFTVQLANTNLDEDRDMEVFLVTASNRNAARVSLAGTQLGSEFVTIPAGGSVLLDLMVERGRQVYRHENLLIGARPACTDGEPEDFETKYLDVSVGFKSPCSEVAIVSPESGWIITNEPTLVVKLDDYDLNNPNLSSLRMQYRRLGSDKEWNDIIRTNPQTAEISIAELETYRNRFGDVPYIFTWDLNGNPDLLDGEYELRAVAFCEDLGAEEYSNYSRGTIDRTSLRLFKTLPANEGTWRPNEVVSAQFNKALFEQLLNRQDEIQQNFSLRFKNGSRIGANFLTQGNTITVSPLTSLAQFPGRTLEVRLANVRDESGNAVRNIVVWEFTVQVDGDAFVNSDLSLLEEDPEPTGELTNSNTTDTPGPGKSVNAAPSDSAKGTLTLTAPPEFRAFPNPTTGTLHVRGSGNKEHEVHLRLFNALGALIEQQRFPAGEAMIMTEMDLQQLTPGIYFLKIDSGPEMITKRIIKQ